MDKLMSSLKVRNYLRLIITVLCILIAALVYFTGGTQYVFSHIMYIPIITIAVLLGLRDGIKVAILAGLLLGPFMPLDVSENTMQDPVNWITRLLFFILIAALVGYLIKLTKDFYSYRFEKHSPLTETKIPLLTKFYEKMNSLKDQVDKKSIILINVKIINYDDINDLFSELIYKNIIKEAYRRLCSISELNIHVYARDMQSLLILLIDEKNLLSTVAKIRELFDAHFYINGSSIHLDTVMGSALYYGNVTETLRQTVSASRYSEKYDYYHTAYKQIHKESTQKLVYLGSVLDSLKNDDFYLVFHPIHNILDGRPVCIEALIRWKHKTLGLIEPNDFIPIIEKTDLINPLTEWVLKKSLEAIKLLEKNNIDIPIAINISTRNLFYDNFFETVKKWLNFYNVNPEKIEFEITESALLKNPESSMKALQNLKDIQIKFSIDDFGTGYSSFTYLTKFPFHKLKIDRSFVAYLENEKTNRIIIDTSVFLANKLSITTVAEGVETEKQLNMVRELGCHLGQGYFWTRPLILQDVIAYLKS